MSSWSLEEDHEDGGPTTPIPAAKIRYTLTRSRGSIKTEYMRVADDCPPAPRECRPVARTARGRLWEAVGGGRREYGRLQLSEVHRTRLRELFESCSGWIVFDDDTEESWLPRAEWEERFSARLRAGAKFD